MQELNSEMARLQKQFHGQTDDLSKLDLRVHSLETLGTEGPSSLSFGNIGCQPSVLAKGAKVAYCAQGSPILLFQRTPGGDLRPVSSLSSVGFQDLSTNPKPACTEASRGTFYVEKGAGREADKPLLCVKRSESTYEWLRLGTF